MTDTVKEVIEEFDKFEQIFTQLMVERVKQKTPVLSGKLQSSWSGQIEGNYFVFENPVEYAAHVEFGTEKMAPTGMVSTTMNEAEQIAHEAATRTKLL